MIILTGRTFDHRDTFKRWGGWFNTSTREWCFDSLTPGELAIARTLPGVMITEQGGDSIGRMSREGFDAWLRAELAEPNDWKNEPKLFIGNDETYRHHFAASDPLIFWGFDTLTAFVDHCAAIEPAPEPRDRAWNGNPEFLGTSSFAEAIEMARNGWLGAIGIEDMIETPEPIAKRRVRSIAGGRVSVPRMLSGNPAHMTRRTRLPGHRNITLFVETVSWRGILHDVLLIRAIAVGAIIDNLERNGYRCTVVAVFSSLRGDDLAPLQLAVTLKDAKDRLSLTDISFALGHPSFGRRLVSAAKSFEKCFTTLHRGRARGIVGQAFTTEHQPGPNEFYIPAVGHVNTTDIFKILDIIEPDGLPVKIKRP